VQGACGGRRFRPGGALAGGGGASCAGGLRRLSFPAFFCASSAGGLPFFSRVGWRPRRPPWAGVWPDAALVQHRARWRAFGWPLGSAPAVWGARDPCCRSFGPCLDTQRLRMARRRRRRPHDRARRPSACAHAVALRLAELTLRLREFATREGSRDVGPSADKSVVQRGGSDTEGRSVSRPRSRCQRSLGGATRPVGHDHNAFQRANSVRRSDSIFRRAPT
jgi:hypothetical protein